LLGPCWRRMGGKCGGVFSPTVARTGRSTSYGHLSGLGGPRTRIRRGDRLSATNSSWLWCVCVCVFVCVCVCVRSLLPFQLYFLLFSAFVYTYMSWQESEVDQEVLNINVYYIMYVCMYIYTYIHTYIHTYTHANIYRQSVRHTHASGKLTNLSPLSLSHKPHKPSKPHKPNATHATYHPISNSCVCVCVCVYKYVCIYAYMHVHVYTQTCMYICIYACTCIHTNTPTFTQSFFCTGTCQVILEQAALHLSRRRPQQQTGARTRG
jgi:hypothetical protein